MAAIEKVEVLKGAGSTQFGANAMGGVINIVTSQKLKNKAHLKGTVGDFGLITGELTAVFNLADTDHLLSYSQRKSDGYRENTDFDIKTFTLNTSFSIGKNDVELIACHLDKKFGANSFYSSNFPNQWEHTKTTFLSAQSQIFSGRFKLTPKLYFRKNVDDFLLDRDNPEFYFNHHTTDSFGGEFESLFQWKLGTTVLGTEFRADRIESNNLGSHSREYGGLFLEQQIHRNPKFTFAPAVFCHWYSDWGWDVLPGFNIGFKPGRNFHFYGSVSKGFRIPTFTELYYQSPANIGNQQLKPEKSWTYETGCKWKSNLFEGNISVFTRSGKNLIDWTRLNSANPWQAENITSLQTDGFELDFWFYPKKWKSQIPITKVKTNFTYLNSNRKTTNYESKYVLDYLRYQLNLILEHELFWKIQQTWLIRYKKRIEYTDVMLLDSKIFFNLSKVNIFLEGTNLLNKEYEDFGYVPLPKRWIRVGVEIDNII